MPLVPTPLLPGTSPLSTPGQQPPSARARRIGVLVALPILVAALVAGQVALLRVLFLVPALEAHSGVVGEGQARDTTFQGFVYTWSAREGKLFPKGGYNTLVSLQNMQSQKSLFHMNAVVIPVIADMPFRSLATITWHNGDANNKDTMPEADYIKAITDARKVGLIPILELQVLQQDPASQPFEDPGFIGSTWSGSRSDVQIGAEGANGNTIVIGPTEKAWIDNYTAFAAHYAQLSEKYHLPYFIIGDGLVSVTYDTDSTSAANDPNGIDRSVPGETPCPTSATGRRECEWRHVVHALRSSTYTLLSDHKKTQPGGGFSGKLIYGASWTGATQGKATQAEYDHITWWDAIDYIGIDAFFPLTQNTANPPIGVLENAWHGQGGVPGEGDIVSNIEKTFDTYHKPVVFTAAGYASVLGANSQDFQQGNVSSTNVSEEEQTNDMQALLETFGDKSWWSGVFWSADMPLDRTLQPNWAVSSNWAGPSLPTSKQAGKYLNGAYKDNPLPCSC